MSLVVPSGRRMPVRGAIVAAILLSLSLLPVSRAGAADNPSATFDTVFGEDARRVSATREKTDDIEFAGKLLRYAKSSDDVALKALLLNKSYEFGAHDSAGYATAAEAVELLPVVDPAQADAAATKLLALRRLQYQKASGAKAKADAGAAMLDALLATGDRQVAAKQFRDAATSYREAVRLAGEVDSPRKAEASAKSDHAQKVGLRASQLADQFHKQPSDATARELTLLWLTDLDNPTAAAEFAPRSGDAYLQKVTQWLTTAPLAIDEANATELADWYAKLAKAKEAGTVSKLHRLNRATQLYKQYLVLHPSKDSAGLKARVALDRVEEERKQLGDFLPPLPSLAPTHTPDGAIVLFDGNDLSQWRARGGGEPTWQIEEGAVHPAGATDIETKGKFADYKLHAEFMVPGREDQPNSGIFLQDCFELQIACFTTPANMGTGSFFNKIAPTSAPNKAFGQWQTLDIEFHASKFDKKSRQKLQNARATVLWNGVKVHDNVELDAPTSRGDVEIPAPARVRLQNYKGTIIHFRNITITPIAESADGTARATP